MAKKCIFIIGPESSGSKLVARICAHVLNIVDFNEWDGSAWCDMGNHKICHRSLPYNIPPQFPDITKWIRDNENDFKIHFVLTTRDITISQLSRSERWSKHQEQTVRESTIAKKIMSQVMQSSFPHIIWSYETFMFLGTAYLQHLYKFLEVKSDFTPELLDGNLKRINEISSGHIKIG